MFASLILLIAQFALGGLSLLLLLRVYMQWRRLSLRNSLGQFVMATTNWLVLPLRRFLPSWRGIDLASLLPAWLLQTLLLGIAAGFGLATVGGPLTLLWLGLIALLRLVLWLMLIVVLLVAILSWVNPGAPVMPLLDELSRPWLRPFRRHVPLIGGIDISPLLLLLLLQIGLVLLNGLGQGGSGALGGW